MQLIKCLVNLATFGNKPQYLLIKLYVCILHNLLFWGSLPSISALLIHSYILAASCYCFLANISPVYM